MTEQTICTVRHHISATWRHAAIVACIVFGTMYLFICDAYGTPWKDEFFQALCVRTPSSAPEGLLSFWIGHAWCSLFGFTLVSLRTLASVCELLTMTLCSLTLWRMTGKRLLAAVCFFTGCVLLRTETFAIYNWDSGTYLFDAATMCLLVSLFHRHAQWKALAIGCVIALATAGRIPSIALLPMVLVLVGIFYHKLGLGLKRNLLALALILGGWIFSMLLLTTLMAGSPGAYIKLFTEGTMVSLHSLSDTSWHIYRFNWIMLHVSLYWIGAIGCVLLPLVLARLRYRQDSKIGIGNPKKNRTTAILTIVIWTAISALPLVNTEVFDHAGAYRLDFMLGACLPIGIGLLMLLPVYHIATGRKLATTASTAGLWSCAVVLMGMCAGSDAYTERMSVGFALPLIVGIVWNVATPGVRKYLKCMLCFTAVVYTSLLSVHYGYMVIRMHDKMFFETGPYAGLHMEPFVAEEIQAGLPVVQEARRQGIRYMYMGNRNAMSLVAGPDNGPSHKAFHFDIYTFWEWPGDPGFDQVDAIVFRKDPALYSNSLQIKLLREEGFTRDEHVAGGVIAHREKKIQDGKENQR